MIRGDILSINYKEIGIRLKQARGKTSQKDLANELKLSKSYISNVESGAKPSLEYLINIATLFHVSLDWLILGLGSMQSTLENENLPRKELLKIFDELAIDKQIILLGTIKTILQNSAVISLNEPNNHSSDFS